MFEMILHSVQQGIDAVSQLKEPAALQFLEQAIHLVAQTYRQGNKVLIAGNGGSLCDAIHFAEELTGCFREDRAALPAIALADAGHLTCVANDYGFERVFARGIEAYGKPGDVFIALTTSGNSPNIVQAVESAKQHGLKTIAFLGKTGGKLKGQCDLELIIRGFSTSDRIQEAHMAALHILIEGVESLLFPSQELMSTNDESLLTVREISQSLV